MRIWLLLLIAALVFVPVQQARADFELPEHGTPPWVLPASDSSDTSGQSDTERLDGEKECIDWDVIMGLQCNNDYPPGETEPGPGDPGEDPGPEDPGSDDGGPGDSGPDVTVEYCEPDCEIIPTDDGGVIIWIDEPGGDTGNPPGDTGETGDTGALGSTAAEESQVAYHVFAPTAIGSQMRVWQSVDGRTVFTAFKVVDMLEVPTKPAHYQVLLHRIESTLPVPEWINFTITKEQTILRAYLTPPKVD